MSWRLRMHILCMGNTSCAYVFAFLWLRVVTFLFWSIISFESSIPSHSSVGLGGEGVRPSKTHKEYQEVWRFFPGARRNQFSLSCFCGITVALSLFSRNNKLAHRRTGFFFIRWIHIIRYLNPNNFSQLWSIVWVYGESFFYSVSSAFVACLQRNGTECCLILLVVSIPQIQFVFMYFYNLLAYVRWVDDEMGTWKSWSMYHYIMQHYITYDIHELMGLFGLVTICCRLHSGDEFMLFISFPFVDFLTNIAAKQIL